MQRISSIQHKVRKETKSSIIFCRISPRNFSKAVLGEARKSRLDDQETATEVGVYMRPLFREKCDNCGYSEFTHGVLSIQQCHPIPLFYAVERSLSPVFNSPICNPWNKTPQNELHFPLRKYKYLNVPWMLRDSIITVYTLVTWNFLKGFFKILIWTENRTQDI